jgi:hypothetical protein
MNKDYSKAALIEFLDHAAQTGLLPKNAAQSRKTASLKLLDVLHGDEGADLRGLDFDDVCARFVNLHKTDYAGPSLRVYQSRARSAIKDFVEWVDDPSKFKPSSRRTTKHNGDSKQPARRKDKGSDNETVRRNTVTATSGPQPRDKTFTVPVPLRDGCLVEVVGLPIDMRQGEAEKICGVVMAYATKEGS